MDARPRPAFRRTSGLRIRNTLACLQRNLATLVVACAVGAAAGTVCWYPSFGDTSFPEEPHRILALALTHPLVLGSCLSVALVVQLVARGRGKTLGGAPLVRLMLVRASRVWLAVARAGLRFAWVLLRSLYLELLIRAGVAALLIGPAAAAGLGCVKLASPGSVELAEVLAGAVTGLAGLICVLSTIASAARAMRREIVDLCLIVPVAAMGYEDEPGDPLERSRALVAADAEGVWKALMAALAAVMVLPVVLTLWQGPIELVGPGHRPALGEVALAFAVGHLMLHGINVYLTLLYFERRRSVDASFMPHAPVDLVGHA